MAQALLGIPIDTGVRELIKQSTSSIASQIFSCLIKTVSGTILKYNTYYTIDSYNIGFTPSTWLLSYYSSYTGNSSLNIFKYDTDRHQAYYGGGQNSGREIYARLNGSICYFDAMHWSNTQGTNDTNSTISYEVSAIFFK